MGDLWLPHLAKWHRDAGLEVVEYPGWLTRSRSSGGYDNILAIEEHHDASSTKRGGLAAAQAHWDLHENRPVGAISTDRDGVHWIGAAGATNTSGKGGPLKCSRGTIPLDSANRFVISRESANNGVGEVWPDEQLAAIVASDAAIIRGLREDGAYNARTRQFVQIILDPLHPGDIHAHFDYAPTRKIDPAGGAGQSPYARLDDRYLRWDMAQFRADVAELLNPQPEDDDMHMAKARIKGYQDQFLLVPITAGTNERIDAEAQAPLVVTSPLTRDQLDEAFGYPLSPLVGENP